MTREAHIARAKRDYVEGRLDVWEFDERVGLILAGEWPPPPEPCRCLEPESVEITAFGQPRREWLCTACGRWIEPTSETTRR